VLSAHNLTIGYPDPHHGDRVISHDLSLALKPGELVCLLGPNGAGKSTLIRTLMRMQPALEGRIELDGRDIHTLTAREIARRVSVVLTEHIHAAMLTAYDLVSLGRQPYTGWLGHLSEQDHDAIRTALEAVDATALATRLIDELSDGERQKVMIARALAQEPTIMLLDEPTAYLDLPHRIEVMMTLRRIAHGSGRAVLLSTHDLDLAIRSADRIWLMSKEGNLHTGAPEDLILNGAFQRAFEHPGLSFDAQTGSFAIEQPHAGVISLRGEGLGSQWTARALERAGFEISLNGTIVPIQVEVTGANGATRWRCVTPEHTVEYISLYDLVSNLRAATQERNSNAS
jgi:iron complex transport system ATP-binding protein